MPAQRQHHALAAEVAGEGAGAGRGGAACAGLCGVFSAGLIVRWGGCRRGSSLLGIKP
jgi:hypothetical protein